MTERGAMERLTDAILRMTNELPEGAPVSAKMLLHLGSRQVVDQSLSRLARSGKLLRAGRGMYVSPVKNRFGTYAPFAHRLVEELSSHRAARSLRHTVPRPPMRWDSPLRCRRRRSIGPRAESES
jgi:hypothetical protein